MTLPTAQEVIESMNRTSNDTSYVALHMIFMRDAISKHLMKLSTPEELAQEEWFKCEAPAVHKDIVFKLLKKELKAKGFRVYRRSTSLTSYIVLSFEIIPEDVFWKDALDDETASREKKPSLLQRVLKRFN